MARPEPTGPSATRSRLKVGQGYFGPLPPELWTLLALAERYPLACSSNYARARAPLVALAASMGWVSTITPDGHGYGREWRVTPEGAFALRNRENGT